MAPPPTPPEPPAGPLTDLLHAWRQGDPSALEQLLPLVYDELRRLAALRLRQGSEGNTLQPTALVNEAFLKLVGGDVEWESRNHFFAVASRAMRSVAVDHWRAQAAHKRGGDQMRVDLGGLVEAAVAPPSVDVMALDEALCRLERMSPQQARVVELRFFAGLALEEIAEVLERSRSSVFRDWRMAKTWLFRELSGEG